MFAVALNLLRLVAGNYLKSRRWPESRSGTGDWRRCRHPRAVRTDDVPCRYRWWHRCQPGGPMSYVVDFVNVSTVGLESSPVADALAGLRANEARYYKNKFDHVFTVEPCRRGPEALEWVTPHPQGGARHRHRVPPARGHRLRGRRHADDLRVLRVRALDQRDVRPRTTAASGRSASSSPTAWRFPRNWRRASSSRARSRSWPAPSAAPSS